MKKKVVISLLLVIITALILLRVFSPKAGTTPREGFRRGGRGGAPRGPVAVETAEIKFGGMEQRKEFIGTIKASYTFVVASKVSGRLSTLTKRVGERVEANEVVATIEDTEYRHNVEEALAQTKISNASVAEAETQLAFLTRETERVSELVSKGVSSQAELDEYSNKLNSQKTRLELSLAQAKQRDIVLKKARTRLAYTRLKAALPGFVAQRHTDGGALLSGNSPVLTIVGIDTVYVEIPVTERDYPMITKGQIAQVSVEAIPGKKFIGVVRSTAPYFNEKTRTAMIEIAVPNDGHLLKPGMFARIDITLKHRDSAQIVPFAALVTHNNSKAVYVVEDNVAYLVPVSLGLTDNEQVEVMKPRLRGNVVTLGAHLLSDSSRVIVESNEVSRKGPQKRGKKTKNSERGKKGAQG